MPNTAIQRLYDQIPSFKCKPGCTDCCGPIVFSKSEWEDVPDKKNATNIDCPYIQKGHCSIYENRPFICRLFGAAKDKQLECPHGCKPEIPLTKEKAQSLSMTYAVISQLEQK